MADQQQLGKLLLTSVRTWNTWRAENTDTHIDLSRANLFKANLSGANLREANLRGANLFNADMSGATGLLSGAEWIAEHFHTARDGSILVWTRKGGGTEFAAPVHWTIAAGKTITETVNPDKCTECACGVNFGTWSWCNAHYSGAQLWAACIEPLDLVDVVVPYNTDGKARCSRLTLVKEVQS